MKLRIASVFWFNFLIASLLAQKPITLEDIWQKNTFAAKGVPGFNFQNDGVHFTRLVDGSIRQFDLRTGLETAVIFDKNSVSGEAAKAWDGKFDSYQFSSDERKLLLMTQEEAIYRRSSKGQFFIFDLEKKELSRLHDGDKQRYATFSPDGSRVAYELANDLYVKELTQNKITRLTADGKPNAIINGAADWCYEEEFEIARCFEWSPDGQKLAWLRFDETAVPEFTMQYFRGATYPVPYTFKYPKVGERNAVVTAKIYDLPTAKTLTVNTLANFDDYLPRLKWTPAMPSLPSGELCLTWLNRHQNHLKLLLADPTTGQCSTLLEEKNEWYLEIHDDLTFLHNGSGFIWSSEKSGFRHLYFYDMRGREIRQLTKGKYEMTRFYGIDERNGELFYQAASKNPMQRELFSVNISGKGKKKLTKAPGSHDAQFSSTFDFFVKNFSTINAPTAWAVFNRKGNGVRVIEDNAGLVAKQVDYGCQPVEFFKFKTSEGVKLNGWMIKPPANKMGGKHPVLMFVYGGPGSQQVSDGWKGSNYWWFQLLAQKGFVVACVDNRGTGGRGEQFKKMTYLQLGKYETLDQIEAAKYLGSLPFVDAARIGIFGWSYGGYMASSCLFKGAGVFKAAIAVAPVTNWKWYDSIYTERFMRTHAENAAGYEDNSPINFAEKMEGNFLLMHGEADDNVHFQHTAELTNRLIKAGKHFDTYVYPNRNHGIGGGGARLHLYSKMTDFLMEKL